MDCSLLRKQEILLDLVIAGLDNYNIASQNMILKKFHSLYNGVPSGGEYTSYSVTTGFILNPHNSLPKNMVILYVSSDTGRGQNRRVQEMG